MGFSVVSIIEIIYFISLRPYCASRRDGKKLAKNVKFVEPSNKVWFVEDVDYGRRSRLKHVKYGEDVNESRKVMDLRNAYNDGGSKASIVTYYPYRD